MRPEVRAGRLQEATSGGPVAARSQVAGTHSGSAARCLWRRSSRWSCSDAVPLGVIENVEGLGAELERVGLLDGEVFVQRHVEIQAARYIQGIASSGVAEGQAYAARCGTPRGLKSNGPVLGFERGLNSSGWRGMWVGDDVGVRAVGSDTVGDAGVVTENCIGDAEGRAGRENGNAGKFPVAEENLGNAFEMARGNIVNVADVKNVALVEIGTGVVGSQVVGVYEIGVLPVGRIIERV